MFPGAVYASKRKPPVGLSSLFIFKPKNMGIKQNLLNSIKLQKPKNNVFDLSHDVKMSLNMGELVPTLCMECVPGDKFNISCESLLRFAPLVSPVMHRMDVTMHYFFVPNRILWDNWEKFITQTEVAGNVPAFPLVSVDQVLYTRLHDYLGIPTPIVGPPPEAISAMPLAAYQAIYNEYYRDQNLVPEISYKLIDGDNNANAALRVLRQRAWEHDYFTASLPFAQKGNAVDIPIGTQQVILDPDSEGTPQVVRLADDHGTLMPSGTLEAMPSASEFGRQIAAVETEGVLDPNGTLITEDAGEATTINDLRRAFRLQEWLERNARAGTRYVEHILAHFGVRSSDKRLQRPEYITGTKAPVQISEVLNTAGSETTPQGNMAGHGISVTSGQYGHYRCEEHGYIIGIMSVMPKTAYQQGIPKHFLKYQDAFQYYYPAFAHIGEQEVENREIYAFQGTTGSDPFGYVPRYTEYKFMPSRVAGEFKTNLDFWHLGRIFAEPPQLNQAFIECTDAETNRIFAVPSGDVQKLYTHVYHKIRAVRPMPKFGTPSF